jgi:hypothetical protein
MASFFKGIVRSTFLADADLPPVSGAQKRVGLKEVALDETLHLLIDFPFLA